MLKYTGDGEQCRARSVPATGLSPITLPDGTVALEAVVTVPTTRWFSFLRSTMDPSAAFSEMARCFSVVHGSGECWGGQPSEEESLP